MSGGAGTRSPGRADGAGGKLQVGCGPLVLPGWINVDDYPYPGIDHVLDIRKGIPFRGLRFIFAEHFIEHLTYEEGTEFLAECRRALGDDGVLRLSTPNLDWVWTTHYRRGSWTSSAEQVQDCFLINKAFRAWGHQFLYNLETLAAVLHRAGFATVKRMAYGESDHPELRGLERHEKSPDTSELPHIIVVEASGHATAAGTRLDGPAADFLQAMPAPIGLRTALMRWWISVRRPARKP